MDLLSLASERLHYIVTRQSVLSITKMILSYNAIRNYFLDTTMASYRVLADIVYKAAAPIPPPCSEQYILRFEDQFPALNKILSARCSAINVDMNVTFVDSSAQLISEDTFKVNTQPHTKGYGN